MLTEIYVSGVEYYRCGVGAIELIDSANRQTDLFIPSSDPRIMNCLSQINARFGRGSLQVASVTGGENVDMRRDFLSPRYTTRWSDIPIISC